MAGVDLFRLPLDRALNVVTALMVDDRTPTLSVETKSGVEVYDRDRARREVDATLSGKSDEAPTVDRQAPSRPRQAARKGDSWDPETWGLLPEHQRAASAALRFTGGL